MSRDRDVEALYSNATRYAEAGEPELALETLSRLRSCAPALALRVEREFVLSAGPYCDMGFEHLERGDLLQAEKCFRCAACYSPGFSDALTGLGRVCLESGRLGDSRKWFGLALERDPSDVFALTGMGDLAFAEGQLSEAVKWYTIAIDQGDDIYCRQQRADVYDKLGMQVEASRDRGVIAQFQSRQSE